MVDVTASRDKLLAALCAACPQHGLVYPAPVNIAASRIALQTLAEAVSILIFKVVWLLL